MRLMIVMLAAGLAALPLSAQQSTTRGFNLGLHVQGTSLSVEGQDADGGGGGGLTVGYGVNRIVTVFFRADGATVTAENSTALAGDWTLGHVEVGTRFHFANALRRWVPWLEAALGARVVSVKDVVVNEEQIEDVSFNGGALTVGGGLSFYVNEGFALDLGLEGSFGEFTEIEVGAASLGNLDIDATSARLNLGFVWWP